eukprot:TRINITY_DN71134_c0_g1_i1.p1 TRINITY_DN71134_c0_g1~~TRINITY_DN71134_c0_g1_i1.p1  ORF type:complete len:460 (+),score=51.23 TRINITY_DN71134_c0_g1_i1:338-1717(+)
MIVIPFGSGVVAAFIFFVFEIGVFPLLFFSTSMLASLFLYWSARKGNAVLVDNMRFPLWSDGLTRHQLSHWFILVFRIVLLSVPVYLETALSSRDVPVMVRRTVENAFTPEPVDEWFSYQNQFGEDVGALRRVANKCFFSCTFMDEEGWVWARIANVTSLGDNRVRIRCVSDTERAVYRLTEQVVGFEESNTRDFLVVNVSWIEGRVEDFPKPLVVNTSSLLEQAPVNETAFRIRSVTSLNDTAMQCFFADSVKTFFSPAANGDVRGAEWRGWCQKQERKGRVAFYVIYLNMAQLPMRNGPLDMENVRGMCESFCKFRRRHASTVAAIAYRGSLEFRDEIALGAKHMANLQPNWIRTARASDMARSVLYSKINNVSVMVRSGSVRATTEVEMRAIFVGILEFVVVVLCALVVSCGWAWKWRNVQQPNTVNGLSKCWAQCEEGESTWISLNEERLSQNRA